MAFSILCLHFKYVYKILTVNSVSEFWVYNFHKYFKCVHLCAGGCNSECKYSN